MADPRMISKAVEEAIASIEPGEKKILLVSIQLGSGKILSNHVYRAMNALIPCLIVSQRNSLAPIYVSMDAIEMIAFTDVVLDTPTVIRAPKKPFTD